MGVSQTFTYVGDITTQLVGGASSLAGLDRKLLTIEGAVNTDNVLTSLKTVNGITAQNAYTHAANVASWNWEDNHVALLVNILRAHHLKQLEESGTLGKGQIPAYNDGHVSIPATGDLESAEPYRFSWPAGQDPALHSEWLWFNEAVPIADVPYLDCRGNTPAETDFILMMMSSWERKSNYIVDFDMPKLAEKFCYRAHGPSIRPDEWIDGDIPSPDYPTPSAATMWSAYRKYVTHNRLFNQAYTAMYLFTQMLVRPVSNSAEGMAWTHATPHLVLPRFKSVRGRYTFLLEGEGALIQAGALTDWNMALSSETILNTAATSMSVLINIGLYARLYRGSIDGRELDDSRDLTLFAKPETFIAAALSYATGHEAPLNGMGGAYLFYPQHVDTNTITQLSAKVYEQEGYDTYPGGINVLGVPLAANPYTVYPLATFDTPSPFSGAFVVNPASKYTRTSAHYGLAEAWKYAWAARVAGYDLASQVDADTAGLTKFYAANSDSWTHIPASYADEDATKVMVKTAVMRLNHFVDIPNNTRVGSAKPFDVKITLVDSYHEGALGVTLREGAWANKVQLPTSVGLQVITSGDATMYWGAVKRTNQGLTMSDTARPAVVPDVSNQAGNIDLSQAGEPPLEE